MVISCRLIELQGLVSVKGYGQRVVTFKDIDKVHERPEGTASRNFRENKEYFILNEDYFIVGGQELKELKQATNFVGSNAREIIHVTEMGYLMIAKSLTDSLAWRVQRDLVNTYFKFQEIIQAIEPTNNGLMLSEGKFTEAIDTITTCAAVFQSMIDYSTINYKQHQDLLQTAKKRVNYLLDGAHSEKYKQYSRIYFKNLWQDFCKVFECDSYKDLNPLYMADDVAKNWIMFWEYIEG